MNKGVILKKLALAICLVMASGPNYAEVLEFHEHAICDAKAGFCVDHMGISLALTKIYLGEKAEAQLMDRIRNTGNKYFDPTRFTMSGGLTCHTEVKLCWTSRLRDKPHAKAINTLFRQ